MRVLLLTPIPHYLADPLVTAGDTYTTSMEAPNKWPSEIDFVVSFGYRHIISEAVINHYRGRLINIHISLLPWNRGADPNFWSWFDQTPKGISIHAIDAGIDTGDILAQLEVDGFPADATLQSTYSRLVHSASELFAEHWPKLRTLDWNPVTAPADGSYHRVSDKDKWMNKLPLGWGTPVKDVEELGAAVSRNN